MTVSDAVAAFRAAAAAAGVPIAHVIPDGRLHRVAVEGDRGAERTGWYLLHLDGRPAGAWGDWRRGYSATWTAGAGSSGPLPPWRMGQIRREMDQRQTERRAESARTARSTAERAAYLWGRTRPADVDHPYLASHGIGVGNARQTRDSLVLPVVDASGALHSLQYIDPAGRKIYLRGGRIRGHWIPVAGRMPGASRILLAEGWATGMALAEMEPAALVLAATSAGNLLPVARVVRRHWPAVEIVICGDADPVGRREAHRAARAVGGLVAIPTLGPGEGTDWCDALLLYRREAAV